MSSLIAADASRSAPRKRDPARRHKLRNTLLLVLALLALGAALFARGADFYPLDLTARVDHRDFRTLSPAGPLGHGYGIAGTLLVLTNLSYLARRRVARWQLGSMRVWLNMHVLTGLFGSVLILFHSAFQLRSPVATLTSVALLLVVISGLVGRYFYSLGPQPGNTLFAQQVALLDRASPGLSVHLLAALGELPPPAQPARATLLASLLAIPAWLRAIRARKQLVLFCCSPLFESEALDRKQRWQLRAAVRRAAKLSAEPVRAVAGESLLRSWRGLHRFMALLMILSVTGHIVVAWVFGFRWIFSE